MNDMTIIASSRLQNNPVPKLLGELGTEVKFIALRKGEFLLSGKYGVSYMSYDMFVESLKSRLFYRSIIEMKSEYQSPLMIVEGEAHRSSRIDPTTYQNALLFASVTNKVPLLFTANDIETTQLIFMLAGQGSQLMSATATEAAERTADSGQTNPQNRTSEKDSRLEILKMLPEVNNASAQSLMDHFKTLSNIFSSSARTLQKVSGLGPKKAMAIFEYLNRNGSSAS